MRKRKTVWRRALTMFLLIGTILAQITAGAGIGEAMQIAAAESNSQTTVSLEDYIVNALKEGSRRIDVTAYQIPSSQVRVYDDILKMHQELFYVDGGYTCVCANVKNKEIVKYYVPSYLFHIDENGINGPTKDEMAMLCAELEAAAEKAAACAEPGMKPYEKALAVHDYLVLNCKYDDENYMANTIPKVSFTAYGALVNGTAVCEGYSYAFRYIMYKLGIPCLLVTSGEMDHMWNIVQLDGKWYHVDATWDDPTPDRIGKAGHMYFLLSDSKISKKLESSSEPHLPWVVFDGTDEVAISADSNKYDGAFWADNKIRSAICFCNGGWYYSKYQKDENGFAAAVKLVRRENLLNGTEKVVDTAPAWTNGKSFWTSSFMYLAKSGNNLYYNTSTEIRRLDKDGAIGAFSLKEALGGMQIFGFSMQDGNFLYAPYASYSSKTKQTDIRTVAAAKANFKIIKKDKDLKKGVSITKGNLKFVVLDPGKKTVSVEGAASAKGKKFAVNIPSAVTIGGSKCKVTEVKKKGFAKFTKINKVSLGKNITKVGKNAFDGCKAITSLTVKGNVTTFDSKSFYKCKKLKTISFTGTKVPAFKSGAFKGTASTVKIKLAKKMSKKNKTNMKKALKRAGIKKIK